MLRFEARYRYANGVALVCRSDTPYIRFEGDQGWIRVDYPSTMTAEPASVLESVIGPSELRLAEPGLREVAHLLHDRGDAVDALARFLDQLGALHEERADRLVVRIDAARERAP